jgi:hypothetical protein
MISTTNNQTGGDKHEQQRKRFRSPRVPQGHGCGGGRDRRRHAGAVRPGPGAIRQDQGRPDAALHRHLCRPGRGHHQRLQAGVEEQGGKLGGREIEYIVGDDESDPGQGPENANKLVKRDKVDVVIGTVHSGVAMAMAKVLKESGTLLDRAQRRRRRRHRPAVRAQHLPHLVLQLAAGLCPGQGAQGQGPQERRLHHLEVRRRRGDDAGLQGGLREGGRQGHQGAVYLPFPRWSSRRC